MATPQEKLANSLEVLKALQDRGAIAIRSADLSAVHRRRLVKHGFLQEVMKGWYIPARPDGSPGESTAWYASFWAFCAAYLQARFGKQWCLSPECSLSLHTQNYTVPRQLLVRSPKGGNKVMPLPHGTSLFDVRSILPRRNDVHEQDGLRLFALPQALIASSPGFFQANPTDARAALALVRDASVILGPLLEGGHSKVAGRLAGGFRNIGRDRIADDIVAAMRAADYVVHEHDPFATKLSLALPKREVSPYAGRIRLIWQQMRSAVSDVFPASPGKPKDSNAYLRRVQEAYVTDAYHSLSIEGYRVSPALIDGVRGGNWDPDNDTQDKDHRNALAARGYWQSFQAVQRSLTRVLRGENAGKVVDDDHGAWYREMFAPGVAAGLLRPVDLAGYRNAPVYIKRSMHVPPRFEAVPDAMSVFFEMLEQETDAAVRVVLGHFVFVYIHPYMDGNGRTGRFLMNVMMAAGGYPWTVIPLGRRDAYMAALEEASANQNIVPFARFLGQLVKEGLRGKQAAELPPDDESASLPSS